MANFDKILDSKFIDQYSAALAPSFSFVNTQAGAEFDASASPDAVGATVRRVAESLGHRIAGVSDDGREIAIITKKTLMSWELATGVEVSEAGQGSHVRIFVENMPGRPKALLDGKKNAKAAQKLADQVRAAL